MRRFLLPLFLTASLILAACSASPSDQTPPETAPASTESSPPSNPSITIIDSQGSVTVEATPLNLDAPADTLEFDVVLDTHSVDLSMDLAVLATLTTDTGITVQATLWDAPRGGHHVAGKLIFPSMKDGTSVLEGAGKLTLTITDVDVPTRTFEWELQ